MTLQYPVLMDNAKTRLLKASSPYHLVLNVLK